MVIKVLKSVLSFGIQCRKAGCQEFKIILGEKRFPSLPSRTQAPTAEQIDALRAAARAAGHGPAALAYALQFECAMRQWDARGQWVPLSDKRASSVIYRGKKWLGPHWSQIDDNLVLKYKPAKTAFTSGAEVQLELRKCPMVVEELESIPLETRVGPMVVDPKTGRPYTKDRFGQAWTNAAQTAGIPGDFGTAPKEEPAGREPAGATWEHTHKKARPERGTLDRAHKAAGMHHGRCITEASSPDVRTYVRHLTPSPACYAKII